MPNQNKKDDFFLKILSVSGVLCALYWLNMRGGGVFLQTSFDNLIQSLDKSHPLSPQIENAENFCVQTSMRLDRGPNHPQDLFLTDQQLIRDYQKSLEKTINYIDYSLGIQGIGGIGGFRGNALHADLMNHKYTDSITILEIFSNHKDALLNAKDKNNRTPLHLALEIGAPQEVISHLITKENVAFADKDGVTPIMLAMRGAVDAELMKKMALTIPKDIRNQVLQQKDNSGKSAKDWNVMTENQLIERFDTFEVDATRDDNYCTSSLFHANKNSYLATTIFSSETKKVIEEAGLETGTNYWVGEKYPAIKATKENVDKLKAIATEDTTQAQESRKKLSDFWWQDSDKTSPIWQYIGAEMDKISDKLSGVSLVNRFLENQKELSKLIKKTEVKVNSVDQLIGGKTNSQSEL